MPTIRPYVIAAQRAAPDVETIILGDTNDEPQAMLLKRPGGDREIFLALEL